MNRGQIRDEARVLLAETTKSASFFEDADLNYFINEAVHDICMAGLVYEKTETLAVTVGTISYAVGSDHIKTSLVIDPNSKTLTPINPSDLGRYYASSDVTNVTPMYWYNWGVNIYLYPACAGTGAGNYTHYYYAYDSDLAADSNSPAFPTRWHKYLVLFTCYRALMKARQFNDAVGFALEYTKAIGVAVDRYVTRFPEEYRVSGILPKLTSQGVAPVLPTGPIAR